MNLSALSTKAVTSTTRTDKVGITRGAMTVRTDLKAGRGASTGAEVYELATYNVGASVAAYL